MKRFSKTLSRRRGLNNVVPHNPMFKKQYWLLFYLFTLQPNIFNQTLRESTFSLFFQCLNS